MRFDFSNKLNFYTIFLRQHNLNVREHKALDGNYKDAIRLMYKNEAVSRPKSACCNTWLSDNRCTGAAQMTLHFSQPIINDHIRIKIEDNRSALTDLMNKVLADADLKIVEANFLIQNMIR